MKSNEIINGIDIHFMYVIYDLKFFDKYFINFKFVNKILRSLSKIITIQETKD